MLQIIKKVAKPALYDAVLVEVLDQATVPVWVARGRPCDKCQFPFEATDTHVVALHLGERGIGGQVEFMHAHCAQRAILES